MNNLTAEARPDKNGVIVTRWVKSGTSQSASPAGLPAPALALTPEAITAPEDNRASMGAELLDEYGWIKVSDGVNFRSLGEFQDPETASGSCWRVTSELIETVDFGAHGFDCTPTFANAQGDAEKDKINIEHYAVFLSSGDMVVDFTIRQFDPEAPFPLITDFSDWSERMRSHLGPNVELSVGELDEDDDYDEEDDEMVGAVVYF